MPRLRDQHGQSWPWPPLAPAGEQAEGFLIPDAGPVASGASVASPAPLAWIVFLPGAFTPVCTRELGWMQELSAGLSERSVALRVVSCDPAPVLRAVADDLGLTVPLLSDFWPHGAAAQLLGEFDAGSGRALRSSVLMDTAGTVLHRVHAAPGEERTPAQHLDHHVHAAG